MKRLAIALGSLLKVSPALAEDSAGAGAVAQADNPLARQ